MFGLITAVVAATTIEIVEMFSAGVLLAATVYTASNSGRKSKAPVRRR
jgi:hypothetical protein